MIEFVCINCGERYPENTKEYRCKCGGLFDLAPVKVAFDFHKQLSIKDLSLWRYEEALPYTGEAASELTMGEGLTPLVKVQDGLLGKAEYFMPTLSFKDRGAVMLVLYARKMGFKSLAIDSSGNAATAVAAYSARAGIKCSVFVPESTSEKKLAQIKAHGAEINLIKGPREASGAAAREYVEKNDSFYASHIYNPLFYQGTKTYFYEIFEQLGGRFPDGFIIPVGNGTLILGAEKAFEELQDAGVIDKWPRIIGVQASGCAPIYKAFKEGLDVVPQIESSGTEAEGIAIAAPARGEQILKVIRKSGGDMVAIDDDETLKARAMLAAKGIYVEITSAVNYAAYLRIMAENAEKLWVMPFCGAGIKSS